MMKGYEQKKYPVATKRYVQWLELESDEEAIREYRRLHSEGVQWKEIRDGIRQVGILEMEIYIFGTISTVDVLPLLPVTATIYFGSSIRPRISGQSLSAICPGRLLPLPSNPPTNFRTLHTIIVNSFFILPLP